MPSHAFNRLRDFITAAMQMSHVYQPVMLRTLIDKGGKASVSEVAQALLAEDRAQLDYYCEITKRMPGAVLRRRGIVDYSDGEYSLPGFDEMTAAERHELVALCHAKFDLTSILIGERTLGRTGASRPAMFRERCAMRC
jgi:ATP adenylyltransferase